MPIAEVYRPQLLTDHELVGMVLMRDLLAAHIWI